MSFSEDVSVLGLGLGWAVPTTTNRFNRVAKPGPVLSLHYFHYPLDWMALGIEGSVFRFGKKAVGESNFYHPPYGAGSSSSASDIALVALMRLNLFSGRSWTPYLLGGGGWQRFFGEVRDAHGSSKPASSSWAVTTGAGLEAFLGRNISSFFELRYHGFELGSAFAAGSAEAMAYKAGLNYWF